MSIAASYGYVRMHRGWMDNPAFLGKREPLIVALRGCG